MNIGNWNYDSIKKGISSAARVAATAVGRAAEVAKDLAEDLTSFKALKDYKLAGHVATAGPCGTWRIFLAVSKKPGAVYPEVCVWILDKKTLMDQASRAGRVRAFDTFFEQQRRACAQMLRIKHPGVVRVLEPMEESSGQIVLLTEPIFGSLHNVTTAFRDVPTAPEAQQSTKLSQLEVKYGLLHLAETLQFLHCEARLAHSNVNPETVVITRDGGWKLAGFAFVGSAEGFGSGGGAPGGAPLAFEYSGAGGGLPLWDEVMQPPLAYTAPELVSGSGAAASADPSNRLPAAADVFSLGVLAHDLLTGRPLLPASCTLSEYRSRVGALAGIDVAGVPAQLQPTLRAMLSSSPPARPNSAAFASCQWFQEDVPLRALRFLDTMLQRDPGQKVAFIRDLSTFWQQFDPRLLRHRVLPPIVAELRGGVAQLAALPLVLSIMGSMSQEDFQASGILPVLKPIFETADGELLLALVRNVGVFQRLMKGDATNTVLVPLLLRACDATSPRAQEEVLRSVQRVAQDVQYDSLRGALVPKVVTMALRTTSLVVRTAALGMLSGVVHRLDRDAADKMMDVCLQIVAVDKSAGTALAVVRLGDAISRQFGADATAARVIPLISPLLMTPGLTAGQFAAVAGAAQEMLERVRAKRVEELGSAAPVPLAPAAAAAGGSSGAASAAASEASSPVHAAAGRTAAAAAAATSLGASSGWDVGLGASSSRPAAGVASGASWDVPLSSGPSAAVNSSGWDSLATSAPPRPGGGGGSGGATPLAPWTPVAQQPAPAAAPSWQQPSMSQQQQQQQQQRPAGISAGSAAPDIFGGLDVASSSNSAGAGGGWAGLGGAGGSSGLGSSGLGSSGLGGGGSGGLGVGGGMGSTAAGGRSSASDVADIFGGLQVASNGMNGGISQPPPQRAPALRPPPSAKGSALRSGAAAPAGGGDLFAGLSGVGSSAAPAGADPFAPAAPAGGDPFGALAMGHAGGGAGAAGSSGDPFAALLGPGGGGGGMRPAPQQQQQQGWPGSTGGSLI